MDDAATLIPRLQREHVEILGLVQRLKSCVENAAEWPGDDLAALRCALDRALEAHLGLEDGAFYPALATGDDPQLCLLAQGFVEEMGTLSTWWRDYSARWPLDSAATDWPGFKAATLYVIAALDARIVRESRELFPAVENAAAD